MEPATPQDAARNVLDPPVEKQAWRPWRPPARVVVLAAVLVAFAIPLADPSQYALRILATIGIYGLLATGLNIVVGRAGLLDLGYVAFFGLGAYTYAMVASDHFHIHFPFLVALALSTTVAALIGVE